VATLADIHLNNRPTLGSSKPVDNRPARANTTTVNVDSQMSGVTPVAGHTARNVLVDVEVVVVTGVVIGATLRRSKLTYVLRGMFRLKMMWARSVRLLTVSLKWMKYGQNGHLRTNLWLSLSHPLMFHCKSVSIRYSM